jgi:uncharacterized SAM-binding protein YcdF (DUF218 family)
VRGSLAVPLWGAVHLAAICVDGCTDDGAAADLAVVLGNHVAADGTPSVRLQLRLDAALALYRDGRVPRIIVSGGQDPGSPPEAAVMKAYLVARGVADADVTEDRGGINTFETARFVADHVQRHGLRSVVAVSQYYHLTRCKLALRRFGVPEVHGAHAPLRLEPREPWSWLREVVGFYAYALRRYPS